MDVNDEARRHVDSVLREGVVIRSDDHNFVRSTSAQLRDTQRALAASQSDLTRAERERDDARGELFVLRNSESADLARAVGLLKYALHLRQHGENAPGGNETWATFDRSAEHFLRSQS